MYAADRSNKAISSLCWSILITLFESTLSLPFSPAWPQIVPITANLLTWKATPDHFTSTFKSSLLVLQDWMLTELLRISAAFADVLVVRPVCMLLLRQPYLWPRPPDCSHLSKGSMKTRKRSGNKVCPCIVLLFLLIEPISAKQSLILLTVSVYKSAQNSAITSIASAVSSKSCITHSNSAC